MSDDDTQSQYEADRLYDEELGRDDQSALHGDGCGFAAHPIGWPCDKPWDGRPTRTLFRGGALITIPDCDYWEPTPEQRADDQADQARHERHRDARPDSRRLL